MYALVPFIPSIPHHIIFASIHVHPSPPQELHSHTSRITLQADQTYILTPHEPQDVEAAYPLTPTIPSASASSNPPTNPQQQQQEQPPQPQTYKPTGRGGAGNFSSLPIPNGPQAPTQDPTAPPPPIPTETLTTSTPFKGGRGGAGNFVWPDAEKAAREEARREEEVKGKVEREVEDGLARPEGVYLGGKDEGKGKAGGGAEGWERVWG